MDRLLTVDEVPNGPQLVNMQNNKQFVIGDLQVALTPGWPCALISELLSSLATYQAFSGVVRYLFKRDSGKGGHTLTTVRYLILVLQGTESVSGLSGWMNPGIFRPRFTDRY